MSRMSKLRTVSLVAWSLVLLAGLGLVGYAGWQYFQKLQATNNPNPTISRETVTFSTDRPDETKLAEACDSYQVPSGTPRSISLPSIGADGCIEPVGIDQFGAVAVPTNIHLAGWFVESAAPGQPGLSIIDGHINGLYTEDGIFQHLVNVQAGEMFSVTMGDGTILEYKVQSVQSLPVEESAQVLFRHDPAIESQLNLITCGGQFSAATGQFDERVIVVAALQ